VDKLFLYLIPKFKQKPRLIFYFFENQTLSVRTTVYLGLESTGSGKVLFKKSGLLIYNLYTTKKTAHPDSYRDGLNEYVF